MWRISGIMKLIREFGQTSPWFSIVPPGRHHIWCLGQNKKRVCHKYMITLFFFFSSIIFIGLRWVNGKRPVRSRGLKPHIVKVTQISLMTQISLLCFFCIGHKRAKKKSASSAKSAWLYITQIRFLDRTGRFPSNPCVIRGARTFRLFRVIWWIMTHPLFITV